MFYGIYRLLTRLAFALSFPVFLVYALLTGRHRVGLRQRLGIYDKNKIPSTNGPNIWLHGASVGEIKAAEVILERLSTRIPEANLIITTVTEQGLEMAQQQMGYRATCSMAPLDLPGAVKRAIQTIKPNIYLCLETELWPNILAGLSENGTTCFLLNARIGEKSFRRYRRLGGFAKQVLGNFAGVAAISAIDADRLIALGANLECMTVCGNIKYDLPPLSNPEHARRDWQRILGLTDGSPVLVAGSTHDGEELLLLEVFRALKRDLPGLVLVLAPRHLARLETVRGELSATGANFDLLSQIRENGRAHDIVVVDSMGDLATLYSVATFIFCGGSLVERGGHNIMEAARWGRPVFYGPSMKDFTDAKELLEAGGGGFQVADAGELCETIRRMAGDPELYTRAARGAETVASGQNGAVERQLQPVFVALDKFTKQNISQSA